LQIYDFFLVFSATILQRSLVTKIPKPKIETFWTILRLKRLVKRRRFLRQMQIKIKSKHKKHNSLKEYISKKSKKNFVNQKKRCNFAN